MRRLSYSQWSAASHLVPFALVSNNTSLSPAPHLLLQLPSSPLVTYASHIFSPLKGHRTWSQEKTTWSAVLFWARGDMGPSPSSHIVSGAVLTNQGMRLKNALCGRLAGGASALSTLTMSAPPPTIPAAPTAALFTLGTPTLGAIAPLPQPVYSATSWS